MVENRVIFKRLYKDKKNDKYKYMVSICFEQSFAKRVNN